MSAEQVTPLPELSDHERHLLRHALGLNIADEPYRNWFAAGAKDVSAWEDLVKKGFASRAKRTLYDNFKVTDLGRTALGLGER